METPQPEVYPALDQNDVLDYAMGVYAYDSQGNVIPWPDEYGLSAVSM